MTVADTASSVLISVLIGVPVGIAGSFFAWLIVIQYLAPKIYLSPDISRKPPAEGMLASRYYVKFYNERKKHRILKSMDRAMMDVEIAVTYQVRGLGSTNNLLNYGLTIKDPEPPLIGAEDNRIVRLFIERTPVFADAPFPVAVRRRSEEGTLTLEDLLGLNESAKLRVVVTSADAFSGTRKLYRHYYQLADVKEGPFEGRRVAVASASTQPRDELIKPPATSTVT